MTPFQLIIRHGLNGLDINNDNVDVEVRFANGKRLGGTFFTLSNIETLMMSYHTTGECKGGTYFWCANMVIVEKLSEQVIRQTVVDLINTGAVDNVLAELTNE